MNKKEQKVFNLNLKYIEAVKQSKIAKANEDALKAELMSLIPENEIIANVKYNFSSYTQVDNKLYVKELFNLIPKTKHAEAKRLKDVCVSNKTRKTIVQIKKED
jgi:hypothetical protein